MWVKGLENQHVTGSLKMKWYIEKRLLPWNILIFTLIKRVSYDMPRCLKALCRQSHIHVYEYNVPRRLGTCYTHVFTWRAWLNPTTYMSQSHQNRFTTRLLSLIKQLLTIGMEAFMTFQQSRQTVQPRVNFVSFCRRWGRERTYRRARGGASVISRRSF